MVELRPLRHDEKQESPNEKGDKLEKSCAFYHTLHMFLYLVKTLQELQFKFRIFINLILFGRVFAGRFFVVFL